MYLFSGGMGLNEGEASSGGLFKDFDSLQVFVPQVGGGDPGVAESHLDSSVTEEFHQGDEADPSGQKGGGIGVAEAMEGDRSSLVGHVFRDLFELRGESAVDLGYPPFHSDEPFVILAWSLSDFFDHPDGVFTERDESFVVHLAQGDLQVFFISGSCQDTVDREIDQFADSHSGLSEEEEEEGMRVGGFSEFILQQEIVLSRQGSGQIFRDRREF